MNNTKALILFLFAIAMLFFASCKKEQLTVISQEVDSHTTYGLTGITFVNDSDGYACGGDFYTKGVFLRTSDGGRTWVGPDSIFTVLAYCLHFFSANEGIVAGNSSSWAATTDSGKTFSVTQTDYLRVNRIAFSDRQHGVKVGGDGYAAGYIAHTTDGGNTWSSTTLVNHMMGVAYADNNTVFASGYGVIYRSTDAGANFSPLDANGDYFMSTCFPTATTGYFAGYEGLILKTTDAGNSFKKIHKGNAPFSKRLHFENINFWNETTGYVIGEEGLILKTEDGGDSWKTVKAFTNVNLKAIHLFSATSGIVVGDNGKIFLFQE